MNKPQEHRIPIKGSYQRKFGMGLAHRTAIANGFDLNLPITTVDGDEVILLAIQHGHPFPIIGEVHDYNAGIGWLGRWNEAGMYRGTHRAAERHSLRTNIVTLNPSKATDKGDATMSAIREGDRMHRALLDRAARGPLSSIDEPDPAFDAAWGEAAAIYDKAPAEKVMIAVPKSSVNLKGNSLPGLSRLLVRALSEGKCSAVEAIKLGTTAHLYVQQGRLILPSEADMQHLPYSVLVDAVLYLAGHYESKATILNRHSTQWLNMDKVEDIAPEVSRRLKFHHEDVKTATEVRNGKTVPAPVVEEPCVWALLRPNGTIYTTIVLRTLSQMQHTLSQPFGFNGYTLLGRNDDPKLRTKWKLRRPDRSTFVTQQQYNFDEIKEHYCILEMGGSILERA